jgi:phage gpG-like protein
MVRADTRRLQNLQRGIAKLASDAWRRELYKECAEAELLLVDECFAKEQDPYGKPWKPLSYRKGRILDKTGRLKTSFRIVVNTRGFGVMTPVYYARFHQGPPAKGGRDQLKTAISKARSAFTRGHKNSEARAEALDSLIKAKNRLQSRRAFLPYAGVPATWQQVFDNIVTARRDAVLGGK